MGTTQLGLHFELLKESALIFIRDAATLALIGISDLPEEACQPGTLLMGINTGIGWEKIYIIERVEGQTTVFVKLHGVAQMKHSKNERAGQLMGFRTDGTAILEPSELDYHCPVCEYPMGEDSNYDERLTWSEYNAFLWCAVCNRDYPSCLCLGSIEAAIEAFLASVEEAIEHSKAWKKECEDV